MFLIEVSGILRNFGVRGILEGVLGSDPDVPNRREFCGEFWGQTPMFLIEGSFVEF